MGKLVIALSGPPGVGGSTIGKILARKLRLEYFSPGKYYKMHSKERNETSAALSRLKTKQGTSKELHEYIDKLQIEKARRGNVVLEGTLSIHFLKKMDVTSVKIWLDADITERAKRTGRRDMLSLEGAKSKIMEREKIERYLFKKLYGFDYFEQEKDADIVVDSTNLTKNQVVEKIIDFIKQKEAINS